MNEPQTPWSVQLEVVEGCNYACWFCGIHNIRDPKNWHVYRYMDPSLVRDAFLELATWVKSVRVEINNHGEPSLHPDLCKIIQAVHAHPRAQVQVQTNGSLIEDYAEFEKVVDSWFAAGMNLLCLNAYTRWWGPKQPSYSRYRWFLSMADRYGTTNGIPVIDMYHNNPDRLSMYRNYGPKKKMIFVLDDLGEVNTSERTASGRPVSKDICNEAGNTPQAGLTKLLGKPVLTEPLAKKCTRPFRELILSWDGHVPVCCYDWSSQLVLGKFPEASLHDIWYSSVANSVRELLYRKNRHMVPCNVCDYNGGWRQGLLVNPAMVGTDESFQNVVDDAQREFAQFTTVHKP